MILTICTIRPLYVLKNKDVFMDVVDIRRGVKYSDGKTCGCGGQCQCGGSCGCGK